MAKTKPPYFCQVYCRLAWSLCFCSSLQNSLMAFHLKITSSPELRLWFATRLPLHDLVPSHFLSLHSSQATAPTRCSSDVPRTPPPQGLRMCCFLFPEPPCLREQQGFLLHLHAPVSPHQEDAPSIFSNTSPLCHSLSPMMFYFTSLSLPDRCRQSLSVSLHWDTRSRRAGT